MLDPREPRRPRWRSTSCSRTAQDYYLGRLEDAGASRRPRARRPHRRVPARRPGAVLHERHEPAGRRPRSRGTRSSSTAPLDRARPRRSSAAPFRQPSATAERVRPRAPGDRVAAARERAARRVRAQPLREALAARPRRGRHGHSPLHAEAAPTVREAPGAGRARPARVDGLPALRPRQPEPYADVDLRRALAHAIDRDALGAGLPPSFVAATGGLVPPALHGPHAGHRPALRPRPRAGPPRAGARRGAARARRDAPRRDRADRGVAGGAVARRARPRGAADASRRALLDGTDADARVRRARAVRVVPRLSRSGVLPAAAAPLGGGRQPAAAGSIRSSTT